MNGILGNGTDAKSMCNTTSPPMKNLDLKKLLFDFFLSSFFYMEMIARLQILNRSVVEVLEKM